MKKARVCLLIIVTVLLTNFVFAVIPASERVALIALYNSTNGDNWNNNSGWKTPPLHTDGFAIPGTEDSWYGVTLSGDREPNYVEELYLGYNNLTGTLPSQLGNLTNLWMLDLSSNRLSGAIPSQLGNLSNLTYFSLGFNQLSGSLPYQLGTLTNLQHICLYHNQLSGGIPPELGNLGNLIYLGLYNNQLSGSIPSQLGNLNNLQYLLLSNNQLSGSIPSELGNLSNLQYLYLNGNELNGSIPSQLANLNNLQYFYLMDNQLSGSIPSQLANLNNLKGFNVGCNQLSGSIPEQLGNLTHLTTLGLYNNQLSGSIPSQIGNLSQLKELILSHNKLGGSIPTSFTNLTKINILDISYNCLVATDPALRAWLDSHDLDWEADQNECGTATVPSIATKPVKSITLTGAVCGGNVTSTGGAPVTSRGVCWSTSLDPTIADSKTIDGSGTGSFTSTITGLNPGTDYCVRAYATNIKGTAYGSNISFTTKSSPGIPGIGLNHTALNFGASVPGTVTGPQMVLISNTGSGVLNWSASSNAAWLSVTPSSGTGDSVLAVSVNPAGLTAGSYSGSISITDSYATNSPQTITISLRVYGQGLTSAPFGEFATPSDGAAVSGSIPVTGWVLDDIGIANAKIYNGNAYIGDAVFVEGARPDIETAYPTYPNNYKAGWGYMLLTYSLPYGGNGTYTITAKATDMEGNEVTLGSRTITVDNAHAEKPFGAIDTPTQGGTASGNAFLNFGWVLTPLPNMIPVDGSTIDVAIDGVVRRRVIYNVFRSDVAALFPVYANSNGAGGYFYIDTTKLSNGIHTIAWIVTDNAGNSDGIGSRYFTVQNVQNYSRRGAPACAPVLNLLDSYSPAIDEIKAVEIKELERVEIKLSTNNEKISAGYLVVEEHLKELPIGSTLDSENGIFYWQPGPGFVGEYRFAFIGKKDDGQYTGKNILVYIKPKY